MNTVLSYKIEKDGYDKILEIDATQYSHFASIEDNPDIMSFVLMKLNEEQGINTINIEQEETISYYEDSVKVLQELSNIYYKFKDVLRDYYFFLNDRNPFRYELLQILTLLEKDYLYDPVYAYYTIKRISKKIENIIQKNKNLEYYGKIVIELANKFIYEFEITNFYYNIKPFLSTYRPRDRSIYKRLLYADIKPKFVLIKYLSKIDKDLNIVDTYNIDKYTEVFILKNPNEVMYRYYIYPEEYKLFSEEMFILSKARDILINYQPKREDYLDITRLREIYNKITDNLLENLSRQYGISIKSDRYEIIKNILIRYTVGFGILEKIALDDKIQDIFINPPAGISPITLNHADYELMTTNVILTKREVDSWATKLRLISGRPFDEANPVLDTELQIENNVLLRVAAISQPLSPYGISYIFRRHRAKPWTLPLFINNKMLNAKAAALLSFIVSNGRTVLIAGTRGSGKTSLLTALMLELPRKTRIITVEDTLEIPGEYFKKLGYDIVQLKVRSPFSLQTSELTAEDGVRVSLRMGDSALIIGEVRSKEAQTLYEAMRVGALANAVMGTIHAESPYGVYDRVVNDLGVPKTSFKATDIIVIVNPIRDPSTMRRHRRVLRITEVRKDWEEDPLKEKGFVDLMIYDSDKDELEFTNNLLNGDSDILKSIASRDRFLSKSWERIWNYIDILASMKQELVDFANKNSRLDLLEADFVVLANEISYKLISDSINEFGDINKEYIMREFRKWLNNKIKIW